MISATGLRRLAAFTVILLVAATMQLVGSLDAGSAAAATVNPTVVEGNPTCADHDADGTVLTIEGTGELDTDDGGTYREGDLSVSVQFHSTEMGWSFDWDANSSIDVVVAKGGPMAAVYIYGGATSDTGLHAPLNPSSETWYGLSHISFCTGDTPDTTPTTGDTTPTTGDTSPATQVTTPTTEKRSTTTAAPLGAIGDYVWLDLDKDGSQDADETSVVGATVQLLSSDGTLLESQETAVDGSYLFEGLPAGNYRVQVVFGGATYTVPRALGVSAAANSDVDPLGNGVGRTALINLSAGEIDLTWDAGIVVEVLGVQIEATTTTAAVEPVTVETLPFTGSSHGPVLAAAAALALVGVVTVLGAGLRPRRSGAEPPMGSWSND